MLWAQGLFVGALLLYFFQSHSLLGLEAMGLLGGQNNFCFFHDSLIFMGEPQLI
jgi:hypothetical protein